MRVTAAAFQTSRVVADTNIRVPRPALRRVPKCAPAAPHSVRYKISGCGTRASPIIFTWRPGIRANPERFAIPSTSTRTSIGCSIRELKYPDHDDRVPSTHVAARHSGGARGVAVGLCRRSGRHQVHYSDPRDECVHRRTENAPMRHRYLEHVQPTRGPDPVQCGRLPQDGAYADLRSSRTVVRARASARVSDRFDHHHYRGDASRYRCLAALVPFWAAYCRTA